MNKFLCPVRDGGITKGFSSSHWGVDYGWVKVAEAPVYAIADGVVVDNFYSASCGYSLVIKHPTENGWRFATFIHLAKASKVKIGSSVKQGDIVATRGNTGKSNGTHLHFGLTSETKKEYYWNIVKELAINPHPLMCKSKNGEYVGVMFQTMPLLEDDSELELLREQVRRLSNDLATANNKLAQIKNIL